MIEDIKKAIIEAKSYDYEEYINKIDFMFNSICNHSHMNDEIYEIYLEVKARGEVLRDWFLSGGSDEVSYSETIKPLMKEFENRFFKFQNITLDCAYEYYKD